MACSLATIILKMSSRPNLNTSASSVNTDITSAAPPRRKLPQDRVVICGSMVFYAEMVQQKRLLREAGLNSITPIPDTDVFRPTEEDDSIIIKRVASMKHIRKIRDQKTFGILVMNLDKHGISDYIGPNTFAEIAVALAHYKRIYLYQGVPAFYEDELTAWGAIPMNGNLSRLIDDLHQQSVTCAQQRDLFDF